MKIIETAGIIVEYNPVHTGHMHQIFRTRAALGPDAAVVCAMSGNWVQSAAPAVADKWTRARLALLAGADLVLDLPTLWAVSSAETFAWGGVSLLAAAGAVTRLSFGSECGDVAALQAVADCLDSPAYASGLRRFLDKGMPFAACRQAAVSGLLGPAAGELLSGPNNNLGVEYLRALGRLGGPMKAMTVLRAGAGHGAKEPGAFSSATALRTLLVQGRWDDLAPYLVPGGEGVLRSAALVTAAETPLAERAFLARLRTMTAADWAALPDAAPGEGLPDRLVRAGREARSLEEFFQLAKTRRYPHARLRRLALWAFLGLRPGDRPAAPPYLRVLACSGRGREVLRTMKAAASLPIVTKPARVRELDGDCRQVFETEVRCTDLYGLCLPRVPAGGREWRESPAVL